MQIEATYCRKPLAAIFNKLPDCSWVYNQNVTYGSAAIGGAYESGRPDSFVFWNGKVICIECKADFGSVYLGDPADLDNKRGWSAAQRNWWKNVAFHTNTPYFIALWVYSSHERPPRVFHKDAQMFLVPPAAWLALEEEASYLKTRTVALTSELERVLSRKNLNLTTAFARYALQYDGDWHLPAGFLEGNYATHQYDALD